MPSWRMRWALKLLWRPILYSHGSANARDAVSAAFPCVRTLLRCTEDCTASNVTERRAAATATGHRPAQPRPGPRPPAGSGAAVTQRRRRRQRRGRSCQHGTGRGFGAGSRRRPPAQVESPDCLTLQASGLDVNLSLGPWTQGLKLRLPRWRLRGARAARRPCLLPWRPSAVRRARRPQRQPQLHPSRTYGSQRPARRRGQTEHL